MLAIGPKDDDDDPVGRLESALTTNGWTVHRGVAGSLVLSADRTEAGLALFEFVGFQRVADDVPEVLHAFEHKAAGKGKGYLFAASLMPY
jgi:hypothetical protein